VPATLTPGAEISLPQNAAHHASRVLRMREGDPIVLFSGEGGEHAGRILRLSREGVSVLVGNFDPIERESPLHITLVQAVSAGDRMDLTLQKAVELGVTAIQPILAERSVVRLKGDRSNSRREHWQRVAEAACEQCGRNRVPPVAALVALADYRAPDGALKLLLAPAGTSSVRSCGASAGLPIEIAAGPEAGFSPREEAMLVSAGFSPVRLGPRVLRTETAGPAAIAALNALYGDG
jgi:16S rRNA (uracil1498-N3)-methyltransferase